MTCRVRYCSEPAQTMITMCERHASIRRAEEHTRYWRTRTPTGKRCSHCDLTGHDIRRCTLLARRATS